MTTPESLLAIQRLDSAIDLAGTRMPKLPAVLASAAADEAVRAWEARSKALLGEIASHEAAIASAEQDGEALTKQLVRLEQQLKTVIAPREAEALMHEITTIKARRSDCDDIELAAMDAMGEAEAQLQTLAAEEGALRAAATGARSAADEARADSEADIAANSAERDAIRAGLDQEVLSMYDSMRSQHQGVAIAKLNGAQCEGCHLDLSRAEIDEIRHAGEDALPECPNCGRILVR